MFEELAETLNVGEPFLIVYNTQWERCKKKANST